MSIAQGKYTIGSYINHSLYRCDNHYVIEAKTPETEGKMVIEFKAQKGHENKMFVDQREKQRAKVLEDFEEDSESDEDFKLPPGVTNMM